MIRNIVLTLLTGLIAVGNSSGKNTTTSTSSGANDSIVVDNSTAIRLRVMSFNIWVGGGKSIDRTVEVIRASNADVAGIQEETKDAAAYIAKKLGWTSIHTYKSLLGKGCAIISRYPIVAFSESKAGVKLKISDDTYIWMFNVHLNHCPYEPYLLNGIEYCSKPLCTEAEAIASAWNARQGDVETVIADIKKAQEEHLPVFLTGDFNEPSYMDWTERATTAGLCKIPVAWPATKTIHEQTGMKDSYRTVYPDEVAKPGYTWTPRPSENEIMDRIDFVFFWGAGVQVVKSEIAGEKSPESDIVITEYPSDHRAVISVFLLPTHD
jgi:endonuclease/exonuclease/phosphatase family metal-dependent hydrolase